MKTNEKILPKPEDKKKQTSFSEITFKVIAGIITLVVFIVVLVVSTYLGTFNWLVFKVRIFTGLDMWLVKGITLVLMAIFFGTPLSGFVWSFFPIPMKNKKQKRFSFLIALALLCFIAFFTSKNVYFDPSTGQPRMYYSIGVDGKYKLFEAPGFDPQTGDSLKPVTKEIIQKMNDLENKKSENNSDNSGKIQSNASESNNDYNKAYTVAEEVKSDVVYNKPEKSNRAKNNEVSPKVKTEEKIKKVSVNEPDTNIIYEDRELTLREILAGKVKGKKPEVKKVEEVKIAPHGYAVSLLKNKNLRELTNIFGGSEYYVYSRQPIACKVSFINNSSGTFGIYDHSYHVIIKIPPKRTIETVMDPNWYAIKSAESNDFTIMRLPNREEFILEFSDSDIPEPGEIFFGSTSSKSTSRTLNSGGGVAVGN